MSVKLDNYGRRGTASLAADCLEFQETLFDQAMCAEIVERLHDLDAFWLPRHPHLPFYTLGATNYYDITANPQRPYRRLAQQYNPLLLERFPELYAALLSTLRARLQQPIDFLPGAALPGFHIFEAHPDFAAGAGHDILHGAWFRQRDGMGFPGNPIHVDTAHLALGLPAVVAGQALPTLSLTLPLCVPQEGAGLKLWPLCAADLDALDEAAQMQRLRCSASRQVEYRPGRLLVHDGDCYHQARGLPVQGGQYRITLQGHGAWIENQWRLFW